MPWTITRDDRCPVTKPFAVVRDSNGSVEGCHPTRAKARAQQEALYASEAKAFDPNQPRDHHGRWARMGGSGDRSEQAGAAAPRGDSRSGGRARRRDVGRLAEVDVSAQAGYERYVGAIRRNPHAEYIDIPSREDLAQKRAFLGENDAVGVTVAPNGEIGNLFRNPDAPSGAGASAVQHALENGGTWLECYDGGLRRLYASLGFAEVARLRFDPELAHGDFKDAPDVVFMAHGVQPRAGHYVDTWDEAEAAAVGKGKAMDATADDRAVRRLVELKTLGDPQADRLADELRELIGADRATDLEAKIGDAEMLLKEVAWREELHPRDFHGRFARGRSGRRTTNPAKRIDEVMAGVPPEKPNQPSADFATVYRQAQETEKPFGGFLDHGGGLQKRLGADALVESDLPTFERKAAQLSADARPVVVIPPLKQRTSAEEKLKRKSYGAEGLADLNRASVLVKRLADLPGALKAMRDWVDENPGWSLHEVDNGFTRPSGYRDLSVMLRAPNGHVSEVQFHVNSMWAAKFRGGHALYEELRKFDELDRPLTPEEEARKAEVMRATLDLYDAAMKAA